MLFDTHVHYNFPPLYDDWLKHWAKAQANGVTRSVIVGAGSSSSQKAIKIAKDAEGLYAAIGKHPDVYRKAVKIKLQAKTDWQSVFADIDNDINFFRKLISDNRDLVVAVGEIGLDYYRMPEKGDKREWMIAAQKQAFIAQIDLALEFNLPVIIHVRDKVGNQIAHQDALEILRKVKSKDQNFNFVLHCISGSPEYVRQAVSLGAYIGIDGNLTYPSTGSGTTQDDSLIELIKIVPENKLLLETDAPYLAPAPHQAETCQPWMIRLTAEFLEEKLGIKASRMYDNAEKFFNL